MTTVINPETRTVALTPIVTEVTGYVAWLESQGFKVLRVAHAKLPGQHTRITFQVPER